jgi:ubiquinone/menaquinone biosynthesis C-methylase UbiE
MKPRFGTVQEFDRIYIDGDFQNMADTIARHRIERQRFHELLISQLAETRVEPPRVLEIGCGTAIDSLVLAERRDCLACGVDLSTEALKVARKASERLPRRIDLVQADILHLPFEDGSFHMVFSQGVLEHFEDNAPILREQTRILESKGRLVISVPQKYTAYSVVKHYRIRRGTWPWGYETEFSHRDLRRCGRRLGLTPRSVIGYGYWLHPLEPVWILRSLLRKINKLPLFRRSRLTMNLARRYDELWERLENRWGHHFMRDIAIVFEKP